MNKQANELPEQIKLNENEINKIKSTAVSEIEWSAGEAYYPWYIEREKIYLPKSSLEKTQFTKDPDLEMNCCPIYL